MAAFSTTVFLAQRVRARPRPHLSPTCRRERQRSSRSSSSPPSSLPPTPPDPISPTTARDLQAALAAVRRRTLALLLADLCFRVETDHPDTRLAPLRALSATLTTRDLPLAAVRAALWALREDLDTCAVPAATRASLEAARACALHIPRPLPPHQLRHELAVLRADAALLSERASLRATAARAAAALPEHHSRSLRAAARDLGLDDHRVRGKRRLVQVTNDVVRALDVAAARDRVDLTHSHRSGMDDQNSPTLPSIPPQLRLLADRLAEATEDDHARTPLGDAMLLRPRVVDIPNFTFVRDTLLRGGQPSQHGLAWLHQYGVSVVVDLRGSDRANQWQLPPCRSLSSGGHVLRFCNIAVEDFSTPTMDQVDEFLALVERVTDEGSVVFVHCKAGIGRTGTFIACWRVSQGVDVDEALGMEQLYCEDGGGLRQETFVREFASRWKER